MCSNASVSVMLYCFLFILGITLQQKLLSKERIALEAIRNYTEQMLKALDYLHRKSVVHKNFQVSC